jgi:hypothetical protein
MLQHEDPLAQVDYHDVEQREEFLNGSRPYLAQFFKNEQFVHNLAFLI